MKNKTKRVATSICLDEKGDILMGKRKDNGLYSTPGGKLNQGESPSDGMKREFEEETGFKVKKVKLLKARKIKDMMVYLYHVEYEGKKDLSKDPDNEFESVKYTDPVKVADKLHVPIERNLVYKYYMENE